MTSQETEFVPMRTNWIAEKTAIRLFKCFFSTKKYQCDYHSKGPTCYRIERTDTKKKTAEESRLCTDACHEKLCLVALFFGFQSPFQTRECKSVSNVVTVTRPPRLSLCSEFFGPQSNWFRHYYSSSEFSLSEFGLGPAQHTSA